MDQLPALPAARNHSPFGPLFRWLGPIFALTNLSLIPLFMVILDLVFSGLFGQRPSPAKELLPLFLGVELILVAFIPAQALLLTVCLTWSSGSWWRRTATHWLASLIATGTVLAGIPLFWLLDLIYAWASGNLESWPRAGGPLNWNIDSSLYWEQVRSITACTCAIPMILLGVQAPFWAIRLLAGCRLERVAHGEDLQSPEKTSPESLSIRDLFLATALIAASLSLLQFADRLSTQDTNEAQSFLFGGLIVSAVSLVASLLTGVPLVLLFFSRHSVQFCWGATLLATGACAVVVFAILQSVSPTTNPFDQFLTIGALAYGYASGSALGLTLLRRSDWRLLGKGIPRREPPGFGTLSQPVESAAARE